MTPRGPDAKPRPTKLRGVPSRLRARAALRALKTLSNNLPGGRLTMADHRPSGQSAGLVVGRIAALGGTLGSPAVDFARSFRYRLKPIDIAPTTVRDASGRVIATITVDPVTGRRTRTQA